MCLFSVRIVHTFTLFPFVHVFPHICTLLCLKNCCNKWFFLFWYRQRLLLSFSSYSTTMALLWINKYNKRRAKNQDHRLKTFKPQSKKWFNNERGKSIDLFWLTFSKQHVLWMSHNAIQPEPLCIRLKTMALTHVSMNEAVSTNPWLIIPPSIHPSILEMPARLVNMAPAEAALKAVFLPIRLYTAGFMPLSPRQPDIQ